MILQVGMRVKIKQDAKNYLHNAGKTMTITKDLPNFGNMRAFALDDDTGIWCIEDFEKNVDYPDLPME